MFEQGIQSNFFESVIGVREIIEPKDSRIKIYKDLVFYRFYEVLKNNYPVLKKIIGEDKFESLVHSFVLSRPCCSSLWKMPEEFMKYCLNESLLSDFPFADDLFWYEWTEILLLMGNYNQTPETPEHSLNVSWKISDSAKIQKLGFRVYLSEFSEPGEYWLLLYYSFSDHKVYYLETTQFMNDLIVKLNTKCTLDAIADIASEYNLSPDHISEIAQNTIKDYYLKKILVRV